MIKNKKGFTLVELVVAIAALALCSGILLSLYIKSDKLSHDASMYDEAVNRSSNIAEDFKSSKDLSEFLKSMYLNLDGAKEQESVVDGDIWTFYYDNNWNYSDSIDDATIVVSVELIKEKDLKSGRLYKLKLNFYKIENTKRVNVLELVAKKYFKGVVS
jgi:prepilin-type N-terminal cleavage/methylation domain-containing protein